MFLGHITIVTLLKVHLIPPHFYFPESDFVPHSTRVNCFAVPPESRKFSVKFPAWKAIDKKKKQTILSDFVCKGFLNKLFKPPVVCNQLILGLSRGLVSLILPNSYLVFPRKLNEQPRKTTPQTLLYFPNCWLFTYTDAFPRVMFVRREHESLVLVSFFKTYFRSFFSEGLRFVEGEDLNRKYRIIDFDKWRLSFISLLV